MIARLVSSVPVFAALVALALSSQAQRVAVGSSSLIGTLQYSDSFTVGAGASIAARTSYAGTFPLSAPVAVVENVHGNPARSWDTSNFSIATDSALSPTTDSPYPGSSGAGSATGFTQSGITSAGVDWSIPYDLSNDFIVQFDAVQMKDRVDVTIGTTGGNILGTGNLSIFFRRNSSSFPQIGIYKIGIGETNTGLTSGISSAGQWHNYAVRVNIPNQTIEVFVNQTSRGVINLATLAGGAYAPFLTNDFVGIGGAGNDRMWSDNFQVGVPGVVFNSNAPVITSNGGGAASTINILENTTEVTTVTATDADMPAQAITFSKSGADSALFNINSTTGALTFATAPNFEAPAGPFSVTVTASDNAVPSFSDLQTLIVNVTNVNELPTFTVGQARTHAPGATTPQTVAGFISNFDDGDSTVTQTLTLNITGNTNSGLFTTAPFIDSNGTLTYRLNGTIGTATISLTMTDDDTINGTPALTATQTFTISVARGASVGSSSLIQVLHYSDSFTIGAGAATSARSVYAGTFPLSAAVAVVENAHENAAKSWGTSDFSIATDAAFSATIDFPYPGSSGAGSDTGFTQSDLNAADWGIGYGESSHFIIQGDYVQQTDRVNVSFGNSIGIGGAGNLSIFFRTTGSAYPEIGLYNALVGEFNTGLTSGIAVAGQWNNYAVRVNIPDKTMEVFVNEISRGLINLATLNGGAYQNLMNNAFVGIGGSGNNRQWSDNFQVGAPVGPVSYHAPVITSNGGGAAATINIPENTTAVTTVTATDADLPTQASTFSKSGADSGLFNINRTTGALTFATAPNFEAAAGPFSVTVTASDNGVPSLSDSQTLIVYVTNVNDLPTFTVGQARTHAPGATTPQTVAGFISNFDDGDSTVPQTLTSNLTGNTNSGLFTTAPVIDSNGTLTYTLNGTIGTATLSVTLTDDDTINGTPALTATQTFTISVTRCTNVGSSSLIQTLHYSDSFTIGAGATVPSRVSYMTGTFPLPAGADQVENTYGNPARTWGGSSFLIVTDAVGVRPFEDMPYPGTSHAGSDTGFAQVHPLSFPGDRGIAYGLSSHFVMQFDCVEQRSLGVNMSFGNSIGVTGADNLSIFFRHPNILIYNPWIGVFDTGLTWDSAATGQWNNFAVRVDIPARTIEVFVNQISRGLINLATLNGGAYQKLMNNAFISVTGWSDNFQVGAPLVAVSPNAPVITSNGGGAAATINILENTTAVTTVTATDTDLPVQEIEYSISGLNADLFNIDNVRGALTFATAPNFEAAAGPFSVIVTAVDTGSPAQSDSQYLTIHITNVNEIPIFTVGGNRSHPAGIVTPQTVAGFVTGINDGDSSVTQTLTFNIAGNTNPGIFTTAPVIDSFDGTMTYTLNGTIGTATISVTLTDDDSINGTPALTTAAQTFTINALSSGTGVSVGSSSLIDTVHYSDSFSLGLEATVPHRWRYAAQSFPMPAGVDQVENTNGNPARSWGTSAFAIARDTAVSPSATAYYPGSNGAGSSSGFTQRAVTSADWGIAYGVSSHFVIQCDYVQQTDRVTVSFGNSVGIAGAGNLSIFFRTTGSAYPEIGLYNALVGEFNTGLTSGIAGAEQWNNYAVRVNIPAKTMEVFVNQISRGLINLATLNGGAYQNLMDNAFIGVGGAGNDRQWSDNFQVGVPSVAAIANVPIITSNGGGAAATINVPENSTAVTTVTATDADLPAQTITYSKSGADSGLFTINSSTGELAFVEGWDFENGFLLQFAVTVTATDSGLDTNSVSQNLTILVTDVNEMPSFTVGGNRSHPASFVTPQTVASFVTGINDSDSSATQALTFNITGNTNPGIFTTAPVIGSNGTLTYTVNGTIGTATISVTMTDDDSINGTPALTTAAQTFTINALSSGTGVSVGSSSLIETVHYSDSFTIGAEATVPSRVSYVTGTFPLPAGADQLERFDVPMTRSWGTSAFAMATDATVSPSATAHYPGSNGAGSSSGFTQRAVTSADWGIAYGVSSHFVIQCDYVQQTDRVNVSFGNSIGIADAGNLSIFFRTTGFAYPEIGLYNATIGEVNTGLTSGIAAAGQWNNYAVRVNIPAKTIEVFVNQTSRGIINLATLNGGAYASLMNNAFISVGGAGNDRQWSDNFQMGISTLETPSLVVTTTGDVVNPFDSLTTLREAVGYAQTLGGTPTITFSSALAGQTCVLTASGDGTFGPTALLVSNQTLTIDGGTNGVTISQNNPGSGTGGMRIFYVTSSGNLTLKNLTVSGSLAQGGSGSRSGGAAGLGGAVVNAGTLTLVQATFTGNQALGGGVGENFSFAGGGLGGNSPGFGIGGGPNGATSGAGAGFGGGGFANFSEEGVLGAGGFGGGGGIMGKGGFGGGGGVESSLPVPGGFGGGTGPGAPDFEGIGNGGGGAGLGGAIFNYGGTLVITNSTLAGNTARGGTVLGGTSVNNGSGFGGAIFNLNGSVTALHSTIANNTAPQGGGALYSLGDNGVATQSGPVLPGTTATVVLNNTILSGSTNGTSAVTDFIQNTNDSGNGGGPGTLSSSGAGNLILSNALAAQAFAGVIVSSADPMLGPLQNNGGGTFTLALLSGSPAINAGSNALAAALTTDQRGYGSRAVNGTVDIGAFEVSPLLPLPTVASLSPGTGSTAGGTNVTITGTGFTGATSVTIGGATAASLTVVGDTSITCTTPAGSAGTASVLVTTPGGTNAANSLFTYTNVAGIESWRQTWYGTTANTGNAADTSDPYKTGVSNLLAFAFFGPTQDPALANISLLPKPVLSGGNYTATFTQPSGVSGITYGAEWSTTLTNGTWTAIPNTGSGSEHIFTAPVGTNDKFFMRLKVTNP